MINVPKLTQINVPKLVNKNEQGCQGFNGRKILEGGGVKSILGAPPAVVGIFGCSHPPCGWMPQFPGGAQ